MVGLDSEEQAFSYRDSKCVGKQKEHKANI